MNETSLNIPRNDCQNWIDYSPLPAEAKVRLTKMVASPADYSKEEFVTMLRIATKKMAEMETATHRLSVRARLLMKTFRKWRAVFATAKDDTHDSA